MKTTTYMLMIMIFCGMALLPVSLQANSSVAVKDIEYLTGDDFVQIHLKIDRMIAIPDVFYPESGDNTWIVMRMKGVTYEPQQNLYQFDSSVIDTVKINRTNAYTDVEIHLKQQVNYRVFTNQEGLFIEFPRGDAQGPAPSSTVAETMKKAEDKNAQPRAVTPAAAPVTKPVVTESVVEPVMDKPVVDESAQPGPMGAKSRIKDIIVSEKNNEKVKFEIMLTDPVDYEVIPLAETPVRLVLDLKGTRSRQIKKNVEHLNVKRVRGAYNTPSVYRLVFDLFYLKDYRVSMKKKGITDVLEVEFSNSGGLLASAPKPASAPDPAAPSPDPTVSAPAPDSVAVAGDVPAAPGESGESVESPRAMVVSNSREEPARITIDEAPPVAIAAPGESGGTVTAGDGSVVEVKEAAPAIETGGDFFEEEKSRVSGFSPEESSGDGPSEGKNKPKHQVSYLKQTIDQGSRKFDGERMTFNFHNADLADVIKIIAKLSGLNIVLDPGVSGRITSQLTDVPWDQALELFLKVNGLDLVQEGNIVRVGKVDVLSREAEKRRALREAKQMEGDLSVFTRTLSFAKVRDVSGILKGQLSKRGEILEDIRSNTLIISEVPSRINIIDKLIDTLDTPNPQVSIEARIVETNANFIESFGIQWGYNFIADASYGNQTTLKFPNSVGVQGNSFLSQASPLLGPLGGYAVNLPATGATSGTLFTLGNVANTLRLDMALSAMQSKGEGRIISAPKTTTQNNMEASIMQGKQIPVQTIQNNTVTVQYRPAALELKVTPQITADGTIITYLEINNNSADFGNLVNGIPPITTQAIKTTVMISDGGTIVIGGMYRVEKTTTKEGVPVLSKIPILGNLFRNNSRRSEQKELLIFITPRIIK